MNHLTSVKTIAIFLTLVSSWPSWTMAQRDPMTDRPVVPYRWNSIGQVRTLDGTNHRAGAVTFSSDGSSLIVGHDDGTIRRYDATTGRQMGPTVDYHLAQIRALAVSADGKKIAAAAAAPNASPPCDHVIIWKNVDAKIDEISRIPGRVITLAFASDGQTIGAIAHGYDIRVWHLDDHTELFHSKSTQADGREPEGFVTRANFSADLKRAVMVNHADLVFQEGRWNHLVRLWEAGKNEERLVGDNGGFEAQAVACALISPDGSQYIIARELGYVSLSDFASGNLLHGQFPGNAGFGDEITFLMLSPDNQRLVLARKSGIVTVKELDRKLNGNHSFDGPYGYVRAAAFTPKGVRVVSGGWDRLGNEKIAETNLPRYEPLLLWEVEIDGK